MNDKITTKAKRRPGLIELIAVLATVIPRCLPPLAFFGVGGFRDLFRVDHLEPPPTPVKSSAKPTLHGRWHSSAERG